MFKYRHPDLVVELGPESEPKLEVVAGILKELGGEPNPYLAVLVADGDNMGAAISALTSPVAHREFSSTLAGFANSARTIVNDHNGVLVYAGGDDVLAFLPVDKCLSCARKLHDDFGDRLAKYGKPTLSVGIAVVHFMENLEDLLDYGRAAEKVAKKPDRDGLAVHLHKRGGAPIGVRARWSDNPDHRLERFANLMSVVCGAVAGVALADEPKAEAKKAAVEKAMETFTGTWEIVAVTPNGATKDARRLVFHKDGTYAAQDQDGKELWAGTFEIDPTATPKVWDHRPHDAKKTGTDVLGVYELDGETLKVACVVGTWKDKAWAGKPRPTAVDPKAADVVIELKRVRPGK